MQLIKPSFEIKEQESGLSGIYKQIEWAGRHCYKSLDKITEDSAKEFVDRMIHSGHFSMCEHGTIYLAIPNDYDICLVLELNPYTKCNPVNDVCYATTNLRVLVEHDALWLLEYLCEPTEYHEKRITVKFVSDIHFYKDTTRHRVFSWAIESTRFCNYIKKRFDSSVSFITPIWLKSEEQEEFENDLKTIEDIYFKWINKGWQAQQAAYFLIQGTKAEIIMTGFVHDYEHFFDLRSELAKTGKPHPTVVELVEPLRQEFIKKNLIKY